VSTHARPAGAYARYVAAALEADARDAPRTPMRSLALPHDGAGVTLLLKDESAHPSVSLKHRLARDLLHAAAREGRLREGGTIVDASSGSTAISLAWFARRLGLRFAAVVPVGTAPPKLAAIRALGGDCVLVPRDVDAREHARRLAARTGGCFVDQFGRAGRIPATPGDEGLAAAVLAQSREHGAPIEWFVCGAGTGGTSASVARGLRRSGSAARVCVAEPEGTAFARGFQRRPAIGPPPRTLLEGVGRAAIEPGFAFDEVARVIERPDAESIATAWALAERLGVLHGGSSGLCVAAALVLAHAMHARERRGAIVALLGDDGARYATTLYDRDWLAANGVAIDAARARQSARLGAVTAP
jgi:cysteine synthase A